MLTQLQMKNRAQKAYELKKAIEDKQAELDKIYEELNECENCTIKLDGGITFTQTVRAGYDTYEWSKLKAYLLQTVPTELIESIKKRTKPTISHSFKG